MGTNNRAVIVAGVRTPLICSGQGLKDMAEEDLGAVVIREILEQTLIPVQEIQQLIVGAHFVSTPDTPLIMRDRASLPPTVSAFCVQNGELSSLESLMCAKAKIESGQAEVILAGGVQSFSHNPWTIRSYQFKEVLKSDKWTEKIRYLIRLRPKDIQIKHPLPQPSIYRQSPGFVYDDMFMDVPVSLAEQKQYAIHNIQKAKSAEQMGILKEESVAVFPPPEFELIEKDNSTLLKADISVLDKENIWPRRALAVDGAVFFLLMSQDRAKAMGFKAVSLYSVDSGAYDRVLGPVYSAESALRQAGLSVQDIGLLELGDSFSAQAVACLRGFSELSKSFSALGEVPPHLCNVHGGTLALGDLGAANPARMVLSLMKGLKRRKVQWGMALMGIYSGLAGALILKNEL